MTLAAFYRNPTAQVGLPSEFIEPLFADTFSWYLRDYADSPMGVSDGDRLRAALEVINRMTILNQGSGSNGVHASIAIMNLQRLVDRLLLMGPAERRQLISDVIRAAGV
jgi:hypothetical protein